MGCSIEQRFNSKINSGIDNVYDNASDLDGSHEKKPSSLDKLHNTLEKSQDKIDLLNAGLSNISEKDANTINAHARETINSVLEEINNTLSENNISGEYDIYENKVNAHFGETINSAIEDINKTSRENNISGEHKNALSKNSLKGTDHAPGNLKSSMGSSAPQQSSPSLTSIADTIKNIDSSSEMSFMELIAIMLTFFNAMNGALNAQAKYVSGHTDLITFNNNLKDALNSLNKIDGFPKRPDGDPQGIYCDMVDYINGNRKDDPLVKGLGKFMQFLENNVDPELKKKIAACNGDFGQMKTVIVNTMDTLNKKIINVRDKINPGGAVEPFNIENCSRGEEGFKNFSKELRSLDDFTTTISTQVTSVNQDDSANLQALQTSLSAASELLSKVLAAIKELLRTLTS